MKRRGAVRAGAIGAAALLPAGAVSPVFAEATRSKRVVLTLPDAVKTAVVRSPEVKSTTFDVEALPQKAYDELMEAKQNVQALERAYENAKKWVVTALANADLGIGETKDLADAVLAMAKTRAEYFQAVFSYQMGMARLDNAAGRDVEEIQALVAEEKESPTVEVTR